MSSSNESLAVEGGEMKGKFVEEKDQIRVKRKTLQAVLEQCQRALELLNRTEAGIEDNDNDGEDGYDKEDVDRPGEVSGGELQSDQEADELCHLLKSRIQCADFLEKLECAQVTVPEDIAEDCSSWDIINKNDLWDDEVIDLDGEDYVLVRQEDIVEGVACFMAAYLLSLKQTKDLTPNQLQEALSKTFSVKKKKGKLRRAWDGSKVIYNVASWGATAVGIYQNPLLYQAASKAFWTSCNVLSKLI